MVDIDNFWNMAKGFELCSGMTVNYIDRPTSFSITDILTIFFPFFTPEEGY